MSASGQGFPFDEGTSPLFDHSRCRPGGSPEAHRHEDGGSWLFPDQEPDWENYVDEAGYG